jgi:hypothetical protein
MSEINHFKVCILCNITWQVMCTKWVCVLMWHVLIHYRNQANFHQVMADEW